ncbi:MAG: lysozyme inhibitor LprI family protein [Leptolyngbyaceae cyanobacterium]
MIGVIQKIGLGLAASVCLGAIVACQSTSPTAAPPDPAPESEATEPAETEDQAVEPTETTEPAAPPTAASPDTTTSVAPEPQPIPPLPPECNSPDTQLAMNLCAQAEYDQADTELNNAYQSVKATVGDQKAEQLITAEQAWIDYRDTYCDFVQAQFAGGSIQPTVYYGCLTQLTDNRTAVLQQSKSASMGYDAADQALNSVYQSLQGYLSPTEQEQLTDAQLAWIDYRDAHCAFEAGDQNACLALVTESQMSQLEEQLDTRSL